MRIEDGIRNGRWPAEYAPFGIWQNAYWWSAGVMRTNLHDEIAKLRYMQKKHSEEMAVYNEQQRITHSFREIQRQANTVAFLTEVRMS